MCLVILRMLSVTACVVGAGSLGIAMNNGGPVAAVWGWVWVAVMTMPVVSLACAQKCNKNDLPLELHVMQRCLFISQCLRLQATIHTARFHTQIIRSLVL